MGEGARAAARPELSNHSRLPRALRVDFLDEKSISGIIVISGGWLSGHALYIP